MYKLTTTYILYLTKAPVQENQVLSFAQYRQTLYLKCFKQNNMHKKRLTHIDLYSSDRTYTTCTKNQS